MTTLGVDVHGCPLSAPIGVGWRLVRLLPALCTLGGDGMQSGSLDERELGSPRAAAVEQEAPFP